mmetsp:Transcript_72721/g.196700  ORF Transcript_72721/g.196700 Transcript_72721/m.196700 type:complete len:273 (+) Transcript_72721:588-1406(+)
MSHLSLSGGLVTSTGFSGGASASTAASELTALCLYAQATDTITRVRNAKVSSASTDQNVHQPPLPAALSPLASASAGADGYTATQSTSAEATTTPRPAASKAACSAATRPAAAGASGPGRAPRKRTWKLLVSEPDRRLPEAARMLRMLTCCMPRCIASASPIQPADAWRSTVGPTNRSVSRPSCSSPASVAPVASASGTACATTGAGAGATASAQVSPTRVRRKASTTMKHCPGPARHTSWAWFRMVRAPLHPSKNIHMPRVFHFPTVAGLD